METGSGWFVDGRGYVVTNAHVVDPAHRLPQWVTSELKETAIEEGCPKSLRPEAAARAMATMKMEPRASVTVILSNGTELPAQVKKFSPPITLDAKDVPLPDSARDLALLRVKEDVYPALDISTKNGQIGDRVHILGFPSIGLLDEFPAKRVSLEASVTSGAISGFSHDPIGQDVIQTDAPATYGSSGSPAIGDDAALVGVMTFLALSPSRATVVQGFNFLIPAEDVRKFLKRTGVRIGESRFNAPWADALAAFFRGDYQAAAAKLAKVNAVLPNLPDVNRVLGEAQDKVKHPPARGFPWQWIALGVALLSAGLYAGMWGRRRWKNRFRILPAEVIGLIEKGVSPVLLDVRTRDDFEASPLKLPKAIRLPPEDAAAGQINLDAGTASRQVVVTYCTSPDERTSAVVAGTLRQRGFRHVRILKGGLGGWANAGLPVEAKSHLPAIGLEMYKNLTAGDVERRRFQSHQLIFKEGDDPGGEAYLIHAGTVEIRKQFDGGDKILTTLHEGELFGEMALFRNSPRSASAVAIDPVELLVIKGDRLEWLMRNRPQLALEIVKRLSETVAAKDRNQVGQ